MLVELLLAAGGWIQTYEVIDPSSGRLLPNPKGVVPTRSYTLEFEEDGHQQIGFRFDPESEANRKFPLGVSGYIKLRFSGIRDESARKILLPSSSSVSSGLFEIVPKAADAWRILDRFIKKNFNKVEVPVLNERDQLKYDTVYLGPEAWSWLKQRDCFLPSGIGPWKPDSDPLSDSKDG